MRSKTKSQKSVVKKTKQIKKGRRIKNIIQRLQSLNSVLSLDNQDNYFVQKNKKQNEIDFLKQNINNYNIDSQTQQLNIVKKIQCSIHMNRRIQNVQHLYHTINTHLPKNIQMDQKIKCFEICQSIERCIFYYYHLDESYKVFYEHTIQQITHYFEQNANYILNNMSFDQLIYFLANSLYYIQNTNQYNKYIEMLKTVGECKRSINIETNDPFENCKKIVKCRYCGHDKVKISTVQERRADEGSTVIYQCTKDHTHTWRLRG